MECTLVPWLNWDEWDTVRVSLFSSQPESVVSALHRIEAWRSRGCLPIAIEATAAFIQIQQQDPYFRANLWDENTMSHEMLAMLYSMAVMRLVNGVVETKRKRSKKSIQEVADVINLPRMVVDIRHEASHHDLPSLHLLRLASIEALKWLISYYWDPQKKNIPYQTGETSNIRKEIKSILRELSSNMKENRQLKLNASQLKKKRGKHCELLSGHNKILSLMARKVKTSGKEGETIQPSRREGITKKITKRLNKLGRIYSLFSSDVVYALLELLLKTVDLPEKIQINLSTDVMEALFKKWKPVIIKFCKDKTEVLLNLLKAVVDMIQTLEVMEDDIGMDFRSLSECDAANQQIEILLLLFAWLVELLEDTKGQNAIKSSSLPRATMVELVRRCLLVFRPGNDCLLDSALHLSKMIGSEKLGEKLEKVSVIVRSHHDVPEDCHSIMTPETFIHHCHYQDKCLRETSNKLELLKLRRKNGANNVLRNKGSDVEKTSRWAVVESWTPCPIGMLPRTYGSSGCFLPRLDRIGDGQTMVLGTTNRIGSLELKQCSGKREATSDLEQLDNTNVKKMRETVNGEHVPEVRQEDGTDLVHLRTAEIGCDGELDDGGVSSPLDLNDGIKGKCMIGGVLRKFGEDEVQAIANAIEVLGP